ncbi:MAG: hypothetical protein V1884_01165, partial [Candidatus Omnitrophota bacterium]
MGAKRLKMNRGCFLIILGIIFILRATAFAEDLEDLLKKNKMPVLQGNSFLNAANVPVAMPTLPGTGATDATGQVSVNFTAGTLFASQLSDLWARVTYDGKTEYWNLDPGLLSADGKTFSMQFTPAFDGK